MAKPGRGPTQRQLRIGEVLRHALSDVFARGETRINDLDQAGITVLEVTIGPDLRKATAYIMPLGGKNAEAVLLTLNKTRKRIRGLVTKKINLKYIPELMFKLDQSLDYADSVERLLENPIVARDIAANGDG